MPYIHATRNIFQETYKPPLTDNPDLVKIKVLQKLLPLPPRKKSGGKFLVVYFTKKTIKNIYKTLDNIKKVVYFININNKDRQMYDFLLQDNQEKNASAYDACITDQNYIEWNGVSFSYTREDREIFFNHRQILEYEWDDDGYSQGEWYAFQLHCWKALGKPQQVVDATFPFLCFEDHQPQLEDIPIEYF